MTIFSAIQTAQNVVLLTHQSPDGDAMGSSLAVYHYIKSLNKAAQVIVPNAFPEFLAWMPGTENVLVYEGNETLADTYLDAADLIICTDFNAPKRIGALGDKMLTLTCPKVMIDHHLYPSDFADFIVSVPEASSTCELVYEVLSTLNSQLSTPIAQCLYTGLMTDTGNFSYNSNRPQIYEMVAKLIATGINKDEIYNAVFNQYSVDRMKLVGYCLYQKMRIFPEHHAALICLNRKELYRFNFQKGDAEGIVNMPLQSKDIHYSVFMREDKASPDEMAKNGGIKTKIKLSFRSQGDRPVNVFASEVFNGGGHANAAGGEYYGPLAEAVQLFLDNYTKYFKA
ncbi:MAG: DHH family phosphoesterase [Paludibacteraceae bacterium]|nr:DHH family phosphoesterase [Paludibacteraceae bacterium]